MKITKLLLIVLSFCMIIVMLSSVSCASVKTDISVNGYYIKTDTDPVIIGDRVYAPIRFVSEALGLSCSWNAKTRIANISNSSTQLKFNCNTNYAYINNAKYSDSKITIMNDRIYVPVRFVSEAFNATVNWDSTYYQVIIEKEGVTVPKTLRDYTYTYDDVYWLARIIQAESGQEPMEGKIAVGDVVLNRVASSGFPNTIYDVIFDTAGGIQFQPVANKTIYNTPSHDSIEAAKRALCGENVVGDCLFFLNPDTAQSKWIVQTCTFYASIGNHDFYTSVA
ncbi:MAG: stalk domain-containing protein [Bacillota bacterium]|nr:stalk domain-containing protein [Bacillota bacterium]